MRMIGPSSLCTVLALLAFGPANVEAAKVQRPIEGQLFVEDKAVLFTKEGIEKAEKAVSEATFKAAANYTIVTFSSVPESKKADFQAVVKDKPKAPAFFADWARSIADDRAEKGIVTLVYFDAERFYVTTVADKQADLYRSFGDADCKKLSDKLIDSIRKSRTLKGDEAKAERDLGLLTAANFVVDQLKNTTVPEETTKSSNPVNKKEGGMSVGGWICLGVCVLLGIWVMVALIRALTGGGGGYGYGGGGYGGGGGGMGFMGSFMAGMFGAAAGMWMYNSFMGGNHMSDMSAGESYGGDTGGDVDTGAGDYDNGAEGGGGDWGGGDDAGAGAGGDWGGGDDAGGGGDWGGGDAGGGDFGGGGGDW